MGKGKKTVKMMLSFVCKVFWPGNKILLVSNFAISYNDPCMLLATIQNMYNLTLQLKYIGRAT